MNTINLSGSVHPSHQRAHPLECFLPPHASELGNFLDAQVLPKTQIDKGDQVFFSLSKNGQVAIMQRVDEVVERRPAKGDWAGINPHMDFIRLRISTV